MCEEFCANAKILHCCQFCDTRKNIALKDDGNRQVFRAFNDDGCKVCAVKIDNCVIIDSAKNKSDFLLCVYSKDKTLREIFIIELKGKDLNYAIKQSINTIKELNLQNSRAPIKCRVVLNRVLAPSSYTTEEKKLLNYLKQFSASANNELYDRYKNGQKIEKN